MKPKVVWRKNLMSALGIGEEDFDRLISLFGTVLLERVAAYRAMTGFDRLGIVIDIMDTVNYGDDENENETNGKSAEGN